MSKHNQAPIMGASPEVQVEGNMPEGYPEAGALPAKPAKSPWGYAVTRAKKGITGSWPGSYWSKGAGAAAVAAVNLTLEAAGTVIYATAEGQASGEEAWRIAARVGWLRHKRGILPPDQVKEHNALMKQYNSAK